MRLQTDSEFTVVGIGAVSIAKAFKAIRKIDPLLSLGEFQKRINEGAVLAKVATYRNEVSEYLENLKSVLDVMNELVQCFSRVVLTDSTCGEISIDDIRITLDFHVGYQPKDLVEYFSEFIYSLECADWMANSSQPVNDPNVIVCETPPETDSNWVHIQVAIQNQMTGFLVDEMKFHHGCLKVHYDQMMPTITRMTQSQLKSAPAGFFDSRNEPSGVIMLSCIETYFSNLIASTVAVDWVDWLTRGHIPCGWSGQYPEGKLIIW